MASRFSVANVLRQLRGARGAAARSAIRYGKQDLVVLYIEAAIIDMNRAEAKFLMARALARAAASLKRKRAA